MRYLLVAAVLFVTVLTGCVAFAAPVPSTYDDPEWLDYIEKGKTGKLPKGIPTGPGAVSGFHGKGFWPEGYTTVRSPYNMLKSPNLIFSNHSLIDETYYASESMKQFLDATVKRAIELSHNDKFKLPVRELSENESVVPYSRFRNLISLGIFMLADDKPVENADGIYMKGVCKIRINLSDDKYRKYTTIQNKLKTEKKSLLKLPIPEFENRIREIRNDSFQMSADEQKIRDVINANNAKKERPKTKSLRQLQNEDAKYNEISSELKSVDDELDSYREMMKTASDADERRLLNEGMREIREKRRDLTAARKTRSDELRAQNQLSPEEEAERKKYIAEMKAIQEERAARNSELAQRAKALGGDVDKSLAIAKKKLTLDLESTWIMIEAMLTQNDVEVDHMAMPIELKDDLKEYAKNAHKDDSLIKVFDLKTGKGGSQGIVVTLGCSARDRFLGCQNTGGSDEVEKRVSDASSAMLKAAAGLPDERKLEILRLVANANPRMTESRFDTSKLREKYVTDDNPARSYEYLILLDAIDHLRVKNEDADDRKKKARVKIPEKVREYRRDAKKGRVADITSELPF